MNDQTGSMLGVLCALAFFACLLYMPVLIAKNRKVSPDAMSSIKLLCILGLFFGITWLVALCYACIAKPQRPRRRYTYAFDDDNTSTHRLEPDVPKDAFDNITE